MDGASTSLMRAGPGRSPAASREYPRLPLPPFPSPIPLPIPLPTLPRLSSRTHLIILYSKN